MLRSMYSGITGLRNFQTKLDVIGNNISNVNTYGFKKGRTVFKDLVSQTLAGASAPTDNRGGVNPRQVGLGSQIAAIDTLHGQGSTQFTGNTLDLAITGDGFFKVTDGSEAVYTRAGNFYMDRDGHLVDGDGRLVQGLNVSLNTTNNTMELVGLAQPYDPTQYGEIKIPTTASSMSIGQDGTVYYVDYPVTGIDGSGNMTFDTDADAVLHVAGKIEVTKFANPAGLEKIGGNLFRASANSGEAVNGFATGQGFGTIESGFLEMSNVDLAEEFTEMIVAQRGFQANTRIITTSDEILQELVNLKR
ncbi:flagellar basal body rod protein FlgG [Sporosarcina ureilytica]|uniref:Flagellar hook protein FlgE n=1 Tax=Sporosarcina ureilytica TaxID=298596 RepID=A0A1D8JHV3_9BACL|nr:flagellar basal body rod protein FlgG [Sporosarcina ureilytica]AOV08263.1 flagellar basal body rod protein FlgG [Sporosarcina ureilytica]